uniref:NADH-ubiquinone oxidoreductase chain 2 n=1 Tax=Agasicles hygrophila TaxID=715812 RepID=A0A0U2NZA5_9CUCU|nr:NADH dehydrogenase subunit 2 [Agasicles hygrophila]ALJ78611.1 NADH dehydrogenase subunit 2 [Agasicles hygrophila]ASO76769.1 NADH dehydrogenase subunit 2 [Agasicles hygrophila]
MHKFYKLFFTLTLVIGTLISISAYSWMMMWIGLEINLLSIIPLFKSTTNKYPAESTLKYFITQALASTVVLFSIIFMMNLNNIFNLNYWLILVMNSAFMLKLGAAPFHFWFPEVAEGLNWTNNLILLTWQKIAPMILLMYNMNSWFFSGVSVISSILSGLYSLNQTSLRKIMAYSSINHLSWMIASMMVFKSNWIIYFVIYSAISFNIVVIFHILKIYYLAQMLNILNTDKLIKVIFILNFLSLGGLPPFLGFFPKWLVVNSLIIGKFYTLALILIICNLVMLFIYMRIILFSLTISFKESIVWTYKINHFKMMIINILTLFGLFISMNIFSTL